MTLGGGERCATSPFVDDCCDDKSEELAALATGRRRRILVAVLVINLAMFAVELGAGIVARSTALMADSADMLGDAIVYALSLYAVSRSDRYKAGAALVKSGLMLLFGIGIAVDVMAKITAGVTPVPGLMAVFGVIALIANLICLRLLWRHRDDDVNMQSTFECSRNDVIANTGVLVAALGVHLTGHLWPDVLVGSIVALVFLRSAVRVARRAWPRLDGSTA